MEDNKPRYIVTLSDGNAFQLTEQEYKSREDAIFGKDKGATVARINDYSIDDDIDDNAAYTVTSGDNTFLLSADEYKSRRDKIRGMDGVHVGSLSRIDYWGDKLKAINDEINTLKPQRESALAAYNDPANSWDFTGEDMDISAATEAAKRSMQAKSELDDVDARLDKLYRDREANPAWQEQRNAKLKYFNDESAKIDGMFKELNAANEESAKISNSPLAGLSTRTGDADLAWDMRKNPNYYRDKAALTAAKMFYADAVKTESAPSRYDDSKTGFGNFFRGLVGEAPENLSAVALAKSLGENIPLAAAIKQVHEAEGNNANIVELVTKHPERLNYLSPAQKEMLTAFVVKSATDWARSEDISLGYQAGSTAMQSLGFMADFFLVGGLGEAAAKGATKGITKAIAKASVEAGLKGVQRELVQAVPKFLEGTIQAGVKTLVMSPFMPSSYANLLDNIYKINDAGQVDLSGRAIRNAIGDVLIENLSESAGTQVEAILGAPFRVAGKAGIGNIFANTKFGAWGKALKNSPMAKIMKQAGWNGYIGEIGEEWYGNALRVMTTVDPDALKNFATVDQQIITHVSFAPMSLIGGVAMPGAQFLASKKQVAQSAKILSDVLAKNGYDEQTIQNFLDVTKAENPTELAAKLAPVINQAAKDNKDAPAVYKAVMDYAQAIARYRTFDGISEADVEEQRQGMLNEISAQTGFTPANEEESLTAPWIHQSEREIADGGTVRMQSVRVLTDVDGKEMFVVGTPDAEGNVAVVDRVGGAHHFANVNDASLEDSGEMSLNDYLDRELVRKKGTTEQERMAAETQQANAQLIQQAQPGMKVNLGTTEYPDMATILGVDGGNYIVQKADGTTAPFTPHEMAEKLGINTTPKTDAQIEEEQAARLEKRDKNREFANRNYKGKTINWNGQQYTILGVTKGKDFSADADGSVSQEWPYDVQVTDANGQSMTIGMTDQEFEGMLETLFNDALQSAENGEPVAAPAQEETPAAPVEEETPAAPVEDNTPRDFRGNPLPMRTNKRTGQQVVDENALWNKDPEAWARWNDNNPNQRVTSKERLEDQIKDLDKQIEKDTKAVHNAALKGIDADKMDDMEADLAQKIERRTLLSSILDRYNMPAAAGPTIAGEQRKAAAEQTIAQQQAGFPGIQQKWNNAPKVVGAVDEIRLSNGETISGHYVLTEATAPTPSHDPANGFAMTEGFPVDENGKTVNDRDYENDKDAQQAVMEKAEHYDQRALQTPVIVSSDGVVLSGNDRTMAGQIAAYNGWDNVYVTYLAKYPQKYGFTAEQVGQFQNPRVVFVPDAAMPYNAATFAKFNAEDKKSQSKTEKAVKAGKTLTPDTLGTLASLVDRYDDINALYNDADGVNELLDILLAAEVITPEQIAALKDGERLSGTGMDLLESTLIGAALDEEAVRIAMEDANIRKSVVSAIAQIIVGNTLAEYNLRAELTDAIQLVAGGKRAKEIKFGESVQSYIRQQHLFEEDVVAEATVQMLADAINDRKPSFLKKVLSLYNRDAVDSASGQLNLLTGDVLTREAILRNILEYLGYDTKIIFDTSERAAEQQAAAEQPAGPAAEAGPAQQNDAPVQSDAGSTVAQFNREEVAAILEQGNVGETGLAEYMTDDEIAEFMRLWDAFLPYNDALGEAYSRLDADLKDKKKKKAAQAEIDRLEQAQNEAFAPLQEYVDSLLEKYDLSTEQSADVAPVVEDAVADEAAEEMEDEFEDEVEDETEDEDEEPDPDEPKPTKGKKGSKKSSKKAEDRLANSKFEKREGSPILHIKGGATNAQIDKQTYTQEEYEEFIYGHSMFSTYVSKKTGEKIEIVYVDDQNPIYNNHQVMFWRWEPGAEYGDKWETGCTTDYILKYLKANKFKCTDTKEKSSRKNGHGFWMNRHGYCTNPIRVKLPSVRKGWQNFSETTYYQDDSGKWFAGGSASNGSGGGSLSVKRGPYDTKSAAIRATIDALERFRKANHGNNYELRDVDNLIRTLKTKTLPQAMMEEGALNNVPRAEITASELDNGVQGLLFGEEGQTSAPAAAEEKLKRKRTSKKKAETPAASVEETPVEDSEEETEPKFVLEDEEGTPGNFHWVSERVCTNPIIIAAPGLDKRSSVSKIALAEKEGKWYVASYVVEDSGKGTSWGTEIPSFKSNYVPYSSRYAAVKAGIDGIRWLLENMAPKYSNQFGNTWNNTKDLVDYLVRMELPASQQEDNRIPTIIEGLKAFDAAKGRAKFGKAFTNLMKSVGEMLGFADDSLNDALKDAASQFKTEQARFEDVDRAKARYVQRVRKALKDETGNNSMSGYGESSPVVEQAAPAQPKTPAAPAYGSQNKLVTTDQYEELKKKMLAKLNSQLNAGFDPEILAWGAQMAMYHVEAGARKFIDFSQRMIRDLGEGIRPYLQAIYNGARYMPGMEELRKDMDSAADVEAINVDTIALDFEDWKAKVKEGDVYGNERVVSVEPDSAGGAGMITTEYLDTGGRSTTSMPNFYAQYFGQPVVEEQEQTPVPEESTELPEVEQAGWETRPNTEIQGFDGLDSYSVYNACDEYIDRIIGETGLNIAQVDMIAIGSRAFGTAREDSDLDILVEYEGDVKEDAVFNALNAEPLEIMGIKVDFFPIRAQESGTLTEWLESHNNGRPVAQESTPAGFRVGEKFNYTTPATGDTVFNVTIKEIEDGVVKYHVSIEPHQDRSGAYVRGFDADREMSIDKFDSEYIEVKIPEYEKQVAFLKQREHEAAQPQEETKANEPAVREINVEGLMGAVSDMYAGKRGSVKLSEFAEDIQQAREDTDTNPTDAQKKAGNYAHGHLTLDGYDISIENPKGSVRSGKDANGKEWSVTMNNDYGYIRMTEGVDGDHIDIFLSDNPTEGNVFVVDQVNPGTGEFDEHKVMYGFPDAQAAREAYLANYSPGWKGLGRLTEVSKDEFKRWVNSSHRKTKPFSEYSSVKTEGDVLVENATPIERYARENFTKISDLTKAETDKAISIFNALWNTNGEYEGETDGVRRYVADEYGVSQDYQNFLRTWDNHLVFISNGNLYQLDLDFAPAGGRSHLVARRYYVRDRQAEENTQELIRRGAPFQTEEAQPSETSGQLTVGELGKYTHTKTGKEMTIVRLTGDRLSSDEFKQLKARAKEFGGYYSSYGSAKGFLFDTEEDAIKFNNINTTTNVSENTDRKTASDTAVISSEAASVASKAQSLAESAEPADERTVNRTIQRIDDTLDKIDDQLALLGYYEADQTGPFHESYGYMKSAEKKAVKDADRLAKKLAADLGIDVGRKTLAKANIAPAGGEVSFRLPLNDGHELYMCINLMPKGYQPGYGYEDDLVVRGALGGGSLAIYFRVENPNASGQARYVTPNNNQPYNVSYADLLKAIRRDARNFLPEAPAATTAASGPVDVLQVAKEQAEKSRKSGKKSVSSQEDGDAMLGGLFDTLYEAEDNEPEVDDTPAPAQRVKPTEVNGFAKGEKVIYIPDQGKRKGQEQEATIYDFEYDGRPVIDSGLAPVLYEVVNWEQIRKIENEPVNNTDNGLQRIDEQRAEGTPADGSGQQQGLQRGAGEESEVPGQESERTDRGGEGGREGDVHGRSRTLRPRYDDSVKRNTRNYRRAKGDEVPKTVAARYKANIAAIRLLKELQDSGKQATKEQMAVLRQYTGWGGLGGYFNNEYSPEYREMRSLLTDEEMQAAALSINTAYYTPTEIIESMWDIAKRLGFEGGNVLEGSAGIGNILASMPKSISERSAITAVELDNITGGILQQLYPDANVQIKGFQEVDIPNGSVDLAITNVPFGDINVYDSKEKDLTRKFGGKIHDFCIAKNIRKLAEGGIGIFISTRGTLDGSSKALRQWIVNEGGADVIGAFRLNNATFEGTKATSDIIVVRKRVNGQVSPNAINVTDTDITRRVDYQTNETEWNKNTRSWEPITGKAAMELNSYFVEHPENMGGEMGFGFEHNDTYRPGSSALWPTDKIDQNKRLAKWAKQFSSMQEEVAPTVSESESVAEDTSATKEGQLITNSKGDICISRSGKAVPIAVNAQKVKGYSKAQVLADYDALKTAINEVLDYQLNNESDEGLKPLLDKLNKAYDRFAKRYDRLNRNTAISFLRNDVDFPSIAAVEDYREKKGIDGKVKIEVKKTSIFSGRVLGAKRIPTPSNAKDGVIVSINQFGRIDIPFIAEALNKDEETVRKEILASGLGFENPLTGNVDVEYEYLSGNVREKLEYARAHNTEGQYDKNVEALEKVIPADIPAHLIEFSLGSDWMPVELYTEYAKEKFGVNDNFVPTMVGGSWILPENTWEMGVNTEKNRAAGVHSEKLRTDKMGHELMIAAMNNTSVVFSRSYRDPASGETITEHDKEATQAATTKMSEMRDDFKEWCKAKMLDTPELAERIAKIYNDTFNAIVPKEIRDTFIPEHFDGMATKLNNGKPLNLRQHQAKAVIRATTEPLMMAHEVGTGKTFTLIATAMEMRRLGTAKKPMIVVQNATLGQFVSSAKELYPNAKILTISESDRTVEGRSAFYAKIKYNDWDMIVVPQSVFEMIPDSEERQRAFIQEKIDEKKFILEQVKQAKNSTAERQLKKELEDLEYEYQYGEKPPKKGKGGKKDAKKEAEAVENAVAKAKKQLDRRTDDVSDFDDMGIDALLIDEAHSYKHLGFSTAMQRGVKGVDATGSKKSAGVYLKTRAVFDKVGWKNVVFATGTPISNTAAEIWTFMKYLMPADVMRQHHIYYFDDFVRNFGNISQSLEFTTSGKFKETTRFASYTNLPELIRIWSSVTDTVRSKDAVAEGDEKLEDKQPKMEGGQARDIYLPQSLSLVDIMNAVRAKLEWYEGLSGKEKKENSHIPLTMFGIAKMAAIDPRLVDKNAQDEPNSKTNKAVEETLRALKDSERYKGTAALFCDNFRRWDYNDAGKRVEGFNIFEEIKRKLVAAGMPEGQIVIMKSGMTTAAKEKIFARVNSGEVRVIMGTTATLGTGVNIQERLFFEAHLDAPNRPMDYTQRNGRILRQGNLHKEWGIPVRVVRFGVEDSLDVTAYQRLSTKAKFIDSIMDGKPLLANGMENRVLEEEDEGEFDNPVAVLSGSQYALLKSQAERELRKLRNKKEQHRQDQIYIERTLKENKNRIAYDEKLINEANANLAKVKAAFPDGAVKEVTIEGRKAKGAEQIAEAIKDKITTPLRSRLDSRRVERGFTNETLNYTMTFDGVPVNIKVDVERMNEYDDKRHEYRPVMRTRVEYSVPRFGIEGRFVQGGYTSIKDIVPDFMGKIATGRYFEDAVNNLTNTVNRLNSDNELMLQRRGKPFADEDKLTEQEKIVADYTEKMKAELAEKEAKYAEMAKNATTSFKLDDVSIDDEDEDSEGETHMNNAVEGAPKLDVNDPMVLAEAIAAVNRVAKRLGLRVVLDDKLEEKGAYTEGTDYVRINLANCESVDDAVETLLHEGVAHFGLREMLGEEGMKQFIADILAKASPAIRAKIEGMAAENGWSLEYAAEEYVAELAQKTDYTRAERSFWREILQAVRDLISSITGRDTYISDDVIREMLVASYANLEEQAHDIERDDMLHAWGYDTTEYEKRFADAKDVKDKIIILNEYLSIVKTSDIDAHVCTLDELRDYLIGRGVSEKKADAIVASYNNPFFIGEYNIDADAAIFLAERVPSIDYFRKEIVHERQHRRTLKIGGTRLLTRVANAFGWRSNPQMAHAQLYNAVHALSNDVESYVGSVSDLASRVSILANEFISYAMQEKYSDKNFDETLKKQYIAPKEAIEIINELYDEGRRNYISRDNGGRAAYSRLSDSESGGNLETPSSGKSGEIQGRSDANENGSGYSGRGIEAEEGITHYRRRTKPAPQKTGIGYKVFFRGRDGKLYPPMVANPNGEATPVGVWLDADAAPVAGQSKTGRPQVKAGGKGTQGGSGTLAYRPGWHLGEIPYAIQFNRINPETGQKEWFPRDFVWAEVEYAADNDYQKEAEAEGMTEDGKYRHSYAGLKRVPEDGFYRYRTNPNPATDPWIITGAMKVNRVLTDEEVDNLVRAAGREPQMREGDVVRNRVAYHGSIANFDAFDINHAGEGEGFQSHGFGHYVSLNEDTAVGYAWNNAFEKADREGKIEPDIAQILRNDSFDDYDSMVARYDELLAKQKADNARELAEERAERTPDMPVIRTLEAEQSHLERYQPLSVVFEGMRNIYTVEIPDDTGDNYIDEMITLSKSGRRRIAEVVRRQDASLLQTAKYGPNWLPRGLETLASVIEREPYAGMEIRRRLANAFGSDKEASRIMHEAGFVGIKYNGRSDGPCVVIFSNDDIRIVNHERFRFMGEIGAKALDDAEEATTRLDNLAVAREMEKAGKKAGKIKQLTGWERGADGLWRYEVPDNVTINEKTFDEIRENLEYNSKTDFEANRRRMDEDAAAVARWDKLWEDYRSNEGEIDKMRREYELVPRKTEYKLSEIINAPELFDAYPQLKNMSVAILESMPGAWGRSWGGAIDLHAAFFMGEGRKYGHKTLLGVLVHELQHEIQRVEGFETGASGRDRDYDERAGEVEARNVTRRREMGVSARLRTLAEETEDVARKDQTFIHRAINDVADSRIGEESTPSPASYTESMGARRLSASETARKCGIEIEFRPSSQMQFNGKPLAGRWINGKMYICLEHCRDAADAVRTVLHEGVGHNGLRRLIGDENMTAFCLDMFRRLPTDARREIAGAAVTKYGGNVAESVEEYLAERAEVMDFENEDYERNFWDIVLDGIRKVLAKIGIDIPLTQRDVRWLMWQSYNANKQTDVLNEAKRQVVANKLGFTLRQQAEKGEAVQIARNKIAEEELAPAARIYNKDVVYWLNRLHETWVDKDNAVHSLVSALEKATGKDAAAFEDIRLALNQQSSKGLAAIEKWERENWVPMQDAIQALMKEKGCDLKDIERYVMIKHGLERNEVFAKRDAKAYYQDLHDSAVKVIDKALEDGKLDQTLHDTLVAKEDAKLDKHVKAVDAGTDVKYKELRKQDYGGLTAMYSEWDAYEPFQEGIESEEEYKARVLQARHPKYTYIDAKGREQVDMAATEDAAMKEVEEFEKGSEKAVEELWKRINNATKATLKHQYDANMLSRQQYLQVSGMFKYYVPLRGFAEDTAEDLYEYYRSDQRGDFEPPLLKAKGRKTEAESPFGYIGSMASSGIAADMKNETKLALYYFVSNRSANDLVTISEVWYEKTGTDENGKSIFSPVYPPFKEDLSGADAKQAYENWENEMKEKAKAGLAFKGTRKLNLHNSVIHIDKNQKDSHIIKFKVGGRDMMMYINGNPRAAQAINNELNVEMSTDYQKVFGKVLRWFSGINTSYNPEFWLSNAQRDALFALMSVDVKEDSEYGKAFRKNFGRLLRDTLTPGKKGGAYSLKRKLDKGELGDERLDKLYKEFVENGGVTGYTTLKNNEEWELELRKYTGQEKQAVAAVKNAFEAVQHFGEAIEQMTRFAAYITSREQGKEIKDAVNDAKELTVNFNRKGSGQAISFKEAAKLRTKNGHPLNPVQKAFVVGASWLPVYGRRFIMFFNASVQGLNAMYKLFKKDKGRMGTWAAAYLALGVIQAVIHGMLDDDDDYLDIPDYERRNNLLLGGKGVYFKWALPQECRVFYGIGDMAVNHMMGRTPNKSILTEILESASDIAPLNPAGGISALAPSAIVPVVEVALNRDYKGSKIYNDMRYLSDEEKKRTPKYTMAYQGTGKPYILLSQFANWLSGGDYADAGWFNINPASVEHILQGATGGAGTTIGKFYKGTVGQVLGEDFTVRNTPFLSRILTVTDDRYRNAHTTELFDYYKAEAEHVKKLVNTYSKNGDDKKLDKLFDSEDYEIMQIYESYKGMMKYYNDELKYTTDKKERKALMREQDALRKEMIQEISDIGSK